MKSLYIAHAVVVLTGGTIIFFWPETETKTPPAASSTVTTASADGMERTTATDPALDLSESALASPGGR